MKGKENAKLKLNIQLKLLSGHALWPEKRGCYIPAYDAELPRATNGHKVQVYIDNVLITTRSESTLIDNLHKTFDSLDKYHLKLNPTKCSFGVPAGQVLGFLISARGIEANPKKIEDILMMAKTAKLHEIKQLARRVAALS
jgi:hypothetical protein